MSYVCGDEEHEHNKENRIDSDGSGRKYNRLRLRKGSVSVLLKFNNKIMDKYANQQIGFLVLKEDGAVLESGGELENDERSANIFLELINLTESVDENFMPNNSCERISIVYEDHCYNICMSNRRIYIVKLRNGGATSRASGSIGGNNGVYVDTADVVSSAVLT